jgi:hypothetical protein
MKPETLLTRQTAKKRPDSYRGVRSETLKLSNFQTFQTLQTLLTRQTVKKCPVSYRGVRSETLKSSNLQIFKPFKQY